jgi:hypothetical protein
LPMVYAPFSNLRIKKRKSFSSTPVSNSPSTPRINLKDDYSPSIHSYKSRVTRSERPFSPLATIGRSWFMYCGRLRMFSGSANENLATSSQRMTCISSILYPHPSQHRVRNIGSTDGMLTQSATWGWCWFCVGNYLQVGPKTYPRQMRGPPKKLSLQKR